MQLGTRWSFGSPPPARLSAAMVDAIRSVEAELAGAEDESAQLRWTLTWLEGHPIAELDTGVVVREGYDGTVSVSHSS